MMFFLFNPYLTYLFNPFSSANAEYTPHDGVMSSGWSLVTVVAPRTGKIIKNGRSVFERGEKLLQNGELHFVFKLSQSSEMVLQS